MNRNEKYDVVILGGGLAGLTLALQLKYAEEKLSILVLEKRIEEAPFASHKVGESTVELGSYYLRDVVRLSDHLTTHQLPKLGFRFFFSPAHRDDMARRLEVGTRAPDPIPTHQIDRGILENELVKRCHSEGVDLKLGAKIIDVQLAERANRVSYESSAHEQIVICNWVVDATGRNSFLNRKLRLEKESEHHINAAWFRIERDIDIDDWSANEAWKNYMGPGRRRLATNHLMGQGYWVWIIPLISGSTSFGIVADPAFHSFDQFNTFSKAMDWLKKHEPVAAKMISVHAERLIDFKVMKHFAHDVKQFYSADGWGITGEAGAFLDAFYSPGTDFIALGNSWLTELITRDLRGENIKLRTMIYEHAHRELLNGWIKLYQNMYTLFGKTQIMLMKIVWDWGTYWSIPTLLFMNGGYTDLDLLKRYSSNKESLGKRFATLNERMQKLFLDWGLYQTEELCDEHINLFDLTFLKLFNSELRLKMEKKELMHKIELNLKTLEHIAAEIFRLASSQIKGTSRDMRVDPYTMTLADSVETLLEKANTDGALYVDESIRKDMALVWFDKAPKINA